MIKNYVPFVVYDGTDRKRVAAKKELPKKGAIKALQQAEPKDYL